MTPIDPPGALAAPVRRKRCRSACAFVFLSFATLTTTGSRISFPVATREDVAGLEMLLGEVFLGTLIAGLVSLLGPASRTIAAQLTSSSPEQGGSP